MKSISVFHRFAATIGARAVAMAVWAPAAAQPAWPTRTTKLVVPFGAGGGH